MLTMIQASMKTRTGEMSIVSEIYVITKIDEITEIHPTGSRAARDWLAPILGKRGCLHRLHAISGSPITPRERSPDFSSFARYRGAASETLRIQLSRRATRATGGKVGDAASEAGGLISGADNAR